MSRSSNYDKETLKRIIRNEVSQMAESGDLTSQERDEQEQMATSTFVASDLARIDDGQSAVSYLSERYDIDVSEFDDGEELQATVSAARSDLREQHDRQQAGYRGV